MKRFKSILAVLTEDSLDDVAFERAIHLARTNEAALTLVDVIDTESRASMARMLTALISGSRGTEIAEDVLAYHRGRLASLRCARPRPASRYPRPSFRGALRRGHPHGAARRTRHRHQGRHGGTARARCLKGFDMHLLRKCPCPVWMLMGPGDGSFDRILAAVDPQPAGNPRATSWTGLCSTSRPSLART
jgi:universal stress protein E